MSLVVDRVSLPGPGASPAGVRRPMVLHVGKYYPPQPGGMERVVQLLCERAAGVESQVLVSATVPRTIRESWNGVAVTRAARFGSIGSVGVCPTLPLELARANPDLTVIHEPNPVALVADMLARQRGPLVVWYHSEVLRPAWKYRLLYRPFLQRALARAARIVVSSPRLVEHAEELRPYAAKCRVIPFGVSLGRFAATPEVQRAADQIRRRHHRPIVLFVGRLVPYKGVSVLLDALETLDADAVIAGTGPLAGALAAQAASRGLGDRVRFAGEVSEAELLALYHACDVFVLPSVTRAEAFGVVQIEAMACGKPVISTSLDSGVPWVNQHDRTGLVVPPGDAAALARAIGALACDPARRRRLGEGGRARVEREFTVERMAERVGALYEEVLGDAARLAL
jgi:glycosyltransferase involved in cell wall biosynthesis